MWEERWERRSTDCLRNARQLITDGETEAGSCTGVLIVSSASAYFSCKLMQRMIQSGPFTMPDCVPEDRNRKARASAQPEH